MRLASDMQLLSESLQWRVVIPSHLACGEIVFILVVPVVSSPTIKCMCVKCMYVRLHVMLVHLLPAM